MSLTLGPIHHWIFQQIGLVEERGERIVDSLGESLGEELREAWAKIHERHPGKYQGQELEGLVDGNIHGSLDGMIAVVQARESALVAWVLERDAAKGRVQLEAAFEEDGAVWGKKVRAMVPTADAPKIFGALRELWLEGMPCDVRLELTDESADRVQWRRLGSPLERYWAGSKVPAPTMAKLHGRWMNAFVKAMDSAYRFEAESPAQAGGEQRFVIARDEGSED